jgi:hypothetical protein
MSNNETSFVTTLDQHVETLAAAESAADIFKALLDALPVVAPRGAMFLIRRRTVGGWGSFGYDPEVTSRSKSYSCGVDQGWLGHLAVENSGSLTLRPSGKTEAAYGDPAASETYGIALSVVNKPIGLIITERVGEEEPWRPQLLSMFIAVAGMRLELLLARKKLRSALEESIDKQETHAVPAVVEPAIEQVADDQTAIQSAQHPVEEESPEVAAARRFARLVATDIRLYNEEAVLLGRQNGDLADRLLDHLTRGKQTFLRRHGELGPSGIEVLREAYIQVLAGGDTQLLPTSVLD